MKEAAARIKINKLLEEAGWRFFAEARGPANIQLEPNVSLKLDALIGLGEDFEKTPKGYIDFLLLDLRGFPFIVLEAKAEDKNPLIGKEQARKYARSQNCRFVILSNGNLHYFWDLGQYLFASFLLGIRPHQNEVDSSYLWHTLNIYRREGQYIQFMRQNVNGLFNREELKMVKIPLPPLATQRAIVAEIEAEQALVSANRELITRFEQKIRTALARVWGESETP